MTEYDYSPEAYERHLATQNRIANWVQHTEQHRPQFENARSPSPPQRTRHHQPPRPLYIHPPSPASDSSEGYAHRPGPMPLSSPPIMMYPPPPPMLIHPSYTAAPHHKPSHHRHRSPHAHSRSHSQQSPPYYSPPVSPGYQYPYPAGGYFVVQRAPGPMPVMSNIPAPPNISSFSSASTAYFQPATSAASSHSAAHLYPPPLPGPDAWSYGAASPSHSVVSGSVPAHYFPQYQGIHSAMASPAYSSPQGLPQLHQRVYHLQTHHYRRSVG
ncbi:hypothetical protein JR316_0001057 [Psilocybe cubensis]|uniref:Uncharacterized protein n=2 Tax=Psilocybe cubensis TaxID=181762 RepID=A0A8H7YAM2_PSICU|nr:hypothetical protein JR316_0001057 [Psilocybe cubensis]KAH9486991.1 hypothetical protein JR316_0001057 [Psilocybe cubensis]